MVITIDGPSGSGKSTVSKLLAKRLNFLYLDTGAMYRVVALQAVRKGIACKEEKRLGEMCQGLALRFEYEGDVCKIFSGNEDVSQAIRTPEMDILASRISAVNEVREAMTSLQRKIAQRGNIVAEGRDMGTVVFPDADFKIFLTASVETRAERRYLERISRGETVSRDGVFQDLKRRDEQDTSRPIAPLRLAEDAKLIDSTMLSPDQVVEMILEGLRTKGLDEFLVTET
ncbi:MAG: (d)CMP kinase [Deltaproteobacteria bacterium]|nr:(d)CMP kinase [Deltaproteobacteria bacterium]MBW2137504.1 (d)CMP kinase [Deltaproteobacteria bacterium]